MPIQKDLRWGKNELICLISEWESFASILSGNHKIKKEEQIGHL